MKQAQQKKQGFTLIELIVVISILVVLLLVLVPTMNGFVKDARRQANTANARSIYMAIIATETSVNSGLYDSADSTVRVCKSVDHFVNPVFWDTAPLNCKITYDRGQYHVKMEEDDYDTIGVYPAY